MVRIGRRIGTRLSGFFIILGLLLCIPGILVLSLSNRIYGSPLVETGQIFQTTVGYNNTIDLTGHMTQGNNYDIRIDRRI